jgi:hypothetical protein
MERERAIISALILLQLILWLGFVVHRSPRFPGSLAAGLLGIAGALLMVLFSVAYAAVKHIPVLKQAVTRRVSMRTLLTWHVYTAILGSILALLHNGHKFESNLGMALTAMMLLAVFSGYVGRHFLRQVSLELREKQDLLSKLGTLYNQTAGELGRQPDPVVAFVASHGIVADIMRSFRILQIPGSQSSSLADRAIRLAESIADLEYAIKAHEQLKRRSAYWLKIHIATSSVFYALLALHIWSGIYFGLRWFS